MDSLAGLAVDPLPRRSESWDNHLFPGSIQNCLLINFLIIHSFWIFLPAQFISSASSIPFRYPFKSQVFRPIKRTSGRHEERSLRLDIEFDSFLVRALGIPVLMWERGKVKIPSLSDFQASLRCSNSRFLFSFWITPFAS